MDEVRWLLVDSCGAVATLAVGRGPGVAGTAEMMGREFSAGWPGALRRLLQDAGVAAGELDVVGVVSGPGSFTGVRVGMAMAKGLCEALGLRLVVLSRLEVLQGGLDEVAVIDAGRNEWYVRDGAVERLVGAADVAALRARKMVTLAESVASLQALGVEAVVVTLGAESGVRLLLRCWVDGMFDDVGSADANYVRSEKEIYAKVAAR